MTDEFDPDELRVMGALFAILAQAAGVTVLLDQYDNALTLSSDFLPGQYRLTVEKIQQVWHSGPTLHRPWIPPDPPTPTLGRP